MEQWKTLERMPRYEISNFGKVRSKSAAGKERILKVSINNYGYALVCLWDGSKRHTSYVHRLVAEVFNPTENISHAVVNHKDKNRLNNHIKNLEWVTYTENMFHRDSMSLYAKFREIEKLCNDMSPEQLEKFIEFGRTIATK